MEPLYLKKAFPIKKVKDSFFIVNQEKGTIVTLNEVSFFLWNHLSEKCNEKGLVELLIQEYDVEHDEAKGDINEFLKITLNSGIIEKVK